MIKNHCIFTQIFHMSKVLSACGKCALPNKFAYGVGIMFDAFAMLLCSGIIGSSLKLINYVNCS